MRVRGVFVLLATLVVVMGTMAFLSLSLTGNVIEANAETPKSPVSDVETPQVSEQKSLSSINPLLTSLSGFALSTSLTGITLHWDAPLDANKVIIWRTSAEDGPWFIHEVVPAEQGKYTDEDMSVFNQYCYKIQSFDGKGLSAFSDMFSALISYDGYPVVVSEDDKRLFEEPDAYVDSSFSESEYLRRLALYNHKTYCEILASSISMQLQLQTLSDCGGIVRAYGDGVSEKNDLLRDFSISAVPPAGTGGKEFGIGGGSGNTAPESPESGASNGGNGAGNSGGNVGNSGGGSPASGGSTPNSGQGDNSQQADKNAALRCDYLQYAGGLYNCKPQKQSYLEQERDELELMKFEIESLMKDLIFPSDNDTTESLLWKKEQYALLSNWYMDRRLRYDVAQHKVLYQRALALEQFGMGFATRGDGEQALKAFEQAREACLEAERLGAYDGEIYTSRLCAARNALKHASILGARDPMLQEAQREYRNLAQEIDTLEDETKREQFLPIAIDAYSGVMQADMREGNFKNAEGALKQIERLDSGTGKALRQRYEQAFVDVIARRLEFSNNEAYELLNRKLRMDESIAEVKRRSGPFKLISYFSLDELADESGRAQLKLTDEQIGMIFVRDAVSRGKTLKEIKEMSDDELAVLFGTTDVQRAAKAGTFMRKAWDNVDVQQYLADGVGAYIFETGQSYLDASVYGKLDDSVKADASTWDFYWSSVAQTADEMFSIEGAAMNLLLFAQLSGKVGLLNNAGKLIVGKELWKAGVQAEQMSAFGVTLAGIKNVVPGIERAGVGIHEAFAASRWGSAIGTFAARHPNSLIAVGAIEGTLIGVGGTALVEHYSPGAGIIFGTITGEFSPLAHLGGSASVATRAGILVTTGNSAMRNNGVTLTKGTGTGGRYEPVIAPEAGAQGTHDTTIFYDSGTGEILGTTKRTAFDYQGRAIPIIEFKNADAFGRYTDGMTSNARGFYQASDGSLSLPYVRGDALPRVLPDADANALLITGEKPRGWFEFGGKQRAERVFIQHPVVDKYMPLMSKGFEASGERMYHESGTPETQFYFQRADHDAGIVGVSDNALVVKAAHEEMQRALSERPMVVRGEFDAVRSLELDPCAGDCILDVQKQVKKEVVENPSQFIVPYNILRAVIPELPEGEARTIFQTTMDRLAHAGIPVYTHPLLKVGEHEGFIGADGMFIFDPSTSTLLSLAVVIHEGSHFFFAERFWMYEGNSRNGPDGKEISHELIFAHMKRSLDKKIAMMYNTKTNELLFADQVPFLSEYMLPVELSLGAAYEYNSWQKERKFIDLLSDIPPEITQQIDPRAEYFQLELLRLSSSYTSLDPRVALLTADEFSFLNGLPENVRTALEIDVAADFHSYGYDSIDFKMLALIHLQVLESHGLPSSLTPDTLGRVRARLVDQLIPYRDDLSEGSRKILDAAKQKIDSQYRGPITLEQGVGALEIKSSSTETLASWIESQNFDSTKYYYIRGVAPAEAQGALEGVNKRSTSPNIFSRQTELPPVFGLNAYGKTGVDTSLLRAYDGEMMKTLTFYADNGAFRESYFRENGKQVPPDESISSKDRGYVIIFESDVPLTVDKGTVLGGIANRYIYGSENKYNIAKIPSTDFYSKVVGIVPTPSLYYSTEFRGKLLSEINYQSGDRVVLDYKTAKERAKAVVVSESSEHLLTPEGIAAREAVNALPNNPVATIKIFNKNLPVQTDDGLLVVSKLADESQAVGRGSKGEHDLRTLEQLIEEPREQLFKIKREDTIIGSSATATTKITRYTIDNVFSTVYDNEKSLHGAKGVVYRDEFGNYHVRFWDEGNIGSRDIHHQDALAELLRNEAEGLKRVGTIIGEERLLQIANDNTFTAKALNEDRRKPTLVYTDENLLNSEGFQFTRDSSGKVVAFDISSSMSNAQIARDIVLDGARLSEMIRAVHESIAPELRGYRIIRVEGLQGLKIRGEVSLPDSLELRELFDYPL